MTTTINFIKISYSLLESNLLELNDSARVDIAYNLVENISSGEIAMYDEETETNIRCPWSIFQSKVICLEWFDGDKDNIYLVEIDGRLNEDQIKKYIKVALLTDEHDVHAFMQLIRNDDYFCEMAQVMNYDFNS